MLQPRKNKLKNKRLITPLRRIDDRMIKKAPPKREAPYPHIKGQRKGSTSSHIYGQSDNITFPQLFQNKDKSWYYEEDWRKAKARAIKTGEAYKFKTVKEAELYAKGSWKHPLPELKYSNTKYGQGGIINLIDKKKVMKQPNKNKAKTIRIKPSKRGTFTAQATKMGMSVQQAASTILNAPEGKYTPAMRKKANFAKNASKWNKKQYGGTTPIIRKRIDDRKGTTNPLVNPRKTPAMLSGLTKKEYTTRKKYAKDVNEPSTATRIREVGGYPVYAIANPDKLLGDVGVPGFTGSKEDMRKQRLVQESPYLTRAEKYKKGLTNIGKNALIAGTEIAGMEGMRAPLKNVAAKRTSSKVTPQKTISQKTIPEKAPVYPENVTSKDYDALLDLQTAENLPKELTDIANRARELQHKIKVLKEAGANNPALNKEAKDLETEFYAMQDWVQNQRMSQIKDAPMVDISKTDLRRRASTPDRHIVDPKLLKYVGRDFTKEMGEMYAPYKVDPTKITKNAIGGTILTDLNKEKNMKQPNKDKKRLVKPKGFDKRQAKYNKSLGENFSDYFTDEDLGWFKQMKEYGKNPKDFAVDFITPIKEEIIGKKDLFTKSIPRNTIAAKKLTNRREDKVYLNQLEKDKLKKKQQKSLEFVERAENKNKIPKAIWGTLISTGIGLATTLLGNASEKKAQQEEEERQKALAMGQKLQQDETVAQNFEEQGVGLKSFYNEKGGKIGSEVYAEKGDLIPVSSDTQEIKGNTHNQGGTALYANGEQIAEAEKDEMLKQEEEEGQAKVYSDKLYPEGSNKTYADIMKVLSKEKGKLEEQLASPTNKLKGDTLRRKIEKLDTKEDMLFADQEAKKEIKGISPEYVEGNKLDGGGNPYGKHPMDKRTGVTEQVEGKEVGGEGFVDNVLPFADNLVNFINTMTKPKPAKPSYVPMPSLKTDVNINAPLSSITEAEEASKQFVKANTASSNVARGNVIGIKEKATQAKNELFAQKRKEEQALENRASEVQSQYAMINAGKTDAFNQEVLNRKLAQRQEISENVAEAVGGVEERRQLEKERQMELKKTGIWADTYNVGGTSDRQKIIRGLLTLEELNRLEETTTDASTLRLIEENRKIGNFTKR